MGRDIRWCSHGSGESRRFAMLSNLISAAQEAADGVAGYMPAYADATTLLPNQ
jgi:hypothetical protein